MGRAPAPAGQLRHDAASEHSSQRSSRSVALPYRDDDHYGRRSSRRIPLPRRHLHSLQSLLSRYDSIKAAAIRFFFLFLKIDLDCRRVVFTSNLLNQTDDPVYLESEDLRREYVMNDTGKIFVGTHRRPKGRRWVYGQFCDAVLPATHLLLEMSGLSPTERGNPVQVARAISSIVSH